MDNIKRILMKNRHQGMRVIAFALSVLLLSGTVSAPLRTFAEAGMNQNAQAEAEIVPEETVDETQVDAQAEIQEEASETDTTENEALVDEIAGDNSGEEVAEEALGVTDEALSEAVTEEVIEENAEEVSEAIDENSVEETSEDAGSKETDSEEAAEELPELTPNAGAETVVAEEIVVDDSDVEALEEDEETDEEISEKPFYEVQVVDGIAVSVSADPGVFPEGASLFVRTVDPSEIAPAEESIEEERDDNVKVASSYTFDIKVFDAEGNEIQPDTSKGKVYVSFAMAEADNANLSADIYHIDDELNVDKLDTETVTDSDNPVVVAETEGFSYYQVEFTYGEMQYVLPGDSEVRLQEILDYLGISGNVTNVYGSNDSLFSAENRDGEWYVIAHQAFSSNEWLKVTLDGVEMDVEILVTDAVSYYLDKDDWYIGPEPDYNTIFNPDDKIDLKTHQVVDDPLVSDYVYFIYLDGVEKYRYGNGWFTINEWFGCAVRYNGVNVAENPYDTIPADDKTFYRYEVSCYFVTAANTVTLDNQSATIAGTTSVSASQGQAMPSITVPTKTGYTFGGYFTGTNGSGTQYYNADGTSAKPWDKTADTTLYAKWTINTYKVKFNGNGSTSGTMTDQNFTYGTAQNLKANAFVRQYTVTYDYNDATGGASPASADAVATFNGWATSENGNKVYDNNQSVNNLTTTNGGTVNLFAKWTNGSVTLPTPTKTGYTFGGWYSGTSFVGNGGSQYTPSTNAALTAKWTPITYSVSYNSNKPASATGNVTGSMDNSSHTYNAAKALTTNGYSLDGWKFMGWNTDADGSGTPYSDGQSVSNLTTTNGATVTLYAQWKLKAAVEEAPQANELTYNGGDQALVTQGTLKYPQGSKMLYKLGNEDWQETIPTGKDYGTYLVYYKAVATSNVYADGEESAVPIEVTIAKATLTITPTSGLTKEYGTTKDITYTVSGLKGDEQQTDVITGGSLTITPVPPVVAENVGEYYIIENPDNPFAAQNYDFAVTPNVIFTIVKRSTPVTSVENLTAGEKPTVSDLPLKIDSEGNPVAQYLAEAPTTAVSGYTVWYQLNDGEWTKDIPTASSDGKYTLKVKYVADSNHEPFPENKDTLTYNVKITVAATIGEQKYGTIEGAVAAWNANGGTLVLQSNASLTSPIVLNTDSEKTLDLNGCEINYADNDAVITVYDCSLSIVDNSETGNGKIENTGTAIVVDGSAELNILSGTISSLSDQDSAIVTYGGDVSVKGGVVTGNEGIDAYNNAEVSVSGGQISTVEKGIYASENVKVNISGGTVTSTDGTGIVADGDTNVNISGGTITSSDGTGIVASGDTKVTISGGTLTSTNGDGIDASGRAVIEISGGEISAHSYGINASGNADVIVTSGKITSSNSAAINAANNVDVSLSGDCILSGDNYGIVSSSNGVLEIKGDADVGETGVRLIDDAAIDATEGITSKRPIVINASDGATVVKSLNEDGVFDKTTEGYLDLVSTFVSNNEQELTIANNGSVKAVESTPYGDLAVTTVVVDANGEEHEIQIPLSPANIQFLLPGLTSADVTYTPASGENPATFVIDSDSEKTFEIPEGLTLVIPAGMEVTIGEDVTLNNNGNIVNNGLLINDGTIQGSGSITNDGTSGDDGLLCNSGTITGNVSIINTNLGGIENEGEISIPEIINNGEESGIINRENGSITSDITGDGIIINIGIITGDLTVLDNGNLDNLGEINGDISSDGKIINTGTINGDVTSSGSVYNTGELTGDVSNLEEGIILNYNGASISGNVNNEGEFHNKGDISGDIVNNGDFENNATYDEEDESKNKIGTISGAITNNGSFLNEGEMSGDVYNSGDLVNDGEMTGDILNDGTFDNNGTLSGGISNSGELINDGNITGDNDISNSGNMINNGTIDTTGIITNHPDAVLENAEGATISSDIDNHGTFNNQGTASGDIVNRGEVNNTGDISGDIVNHSEGELNNAGTVSGNIDNMGVVNNDEEGVISGAIKNENGASVNNNAGATISGDINNEGGTVKNDSEGTISGSIDNEGYLINKGGKVTGDVTTGNDGITITVPKDSKSDVSISEDGKITIPAGSTVTTVDENGKTNTITIPKDASGSDVTYTFDESDLNKISQAKDGTTELPAGTVITRDGEETVLEYGGVIDSKGQVTPNADPNAPQSSGDGSGASGSSDGSSAAGNTANTGKKPGTNSTGNGKKPANTTETDDKELADDEEADEEKEDTETTEGLTDEITSGSAREDKYGSGNVRIEVESVNEDGSISTLTGTLHGSTESILKACLTKEELERVKAGESVVVKLVVMPLEDKVPDSDKKEIEASLGNAANAPLAIGKFIDLTVMKKIGDGDWEKVTDLNEELEITIEIDKELQADGRVFYVLRYHDGEVTTLEDQDNNPETITIKTKLFSTYAIAFIADSNAVKHGFPWWILILLLILVIIASAVTGTIIYIKNRK